VFFSVTHVTKLNLLFSKHHFNIFVTKITKKMRFRQFGSPNTFFLKLSKKSQLIDFKSI